ncbi:MAG TPA: PIN domain nuclease [Actinoplanes sp.]|nr:PIN domain nuclease [Actinoplanes sp.]
MTEGVMYVCQMTELEIYFSSRSLEHLKETQAKIHDHYNWALMPDSLWSRASEVQNLLAQHGKHQSAGVVDLLLAATAEFNGMTILHYDRDFETVARVAGQPVRWVAELGTVS